MFGEKEDPKYMFKMTHTDIQGFPTNAENETIYQIIEEVRMKDLQLDLDRKRETLQQDQYDVNAVPE